MSNLSGTAELTPNEKRVLEDVAFRAFSSLLSERSQFAASMGFQFGGNRDIYTELGYPQQLTFEDYWARYDRDGLAGRVVDKPAKDSWRSAPIITDGDKGETPFIKGIEAINKNLKLWKALADLDRISGVGQYGVLLLGVKDGEKLDKEVGKKLSPQSLIYLRPFYEKQAEIKEWVSDSQDPRFSLPKTYQFNFSEIGDNSNTVSMQSKIVHWSRCIHIAENSIDGVFGTPRLKKSFNRFMDSDKVVGGSAEAAWRLIYKGIVVSERDGYEIGDNAEALEDKFLEYVHKLKRVLVMSGVDVNELGNTEMPDPTGLFGILVSFMAANADMPQRILIGSERGELASSTDQAQWAGTVANRREQHVEPNIIRPSIDWMVEHGVLPEPVSGEYQIEWKPIFEMDDKELAEIGEKKANTIARVVQSGAIEWGVVTTEETRELVHLPAEPEGGTVLDMLDDEDGLEDE